MVKLLNKTLLINGKFLRCKCLVTAIYFPPFSQCLYCCFPVHKSAEVFTYSYTIYFYLITSAIFVTISQIPSSSSKVPIYLRYRLTVNIWKDSRGSLDADVEWVKCCTGFWICYIWKLFKELNGVERRQADNETMIFTNVISFSIKPLQLATYLYSVILMTVSSIIRQII